MTPGLSKDIVSCMTILFFSKLTNHLIRHQTSHIKWAVSLVIAYVWFKKNLDRSTTRPKFNLARVWTHDLQIMTVCTFHVTETPLHMATLIFLRGLCGYYGLTYSFYHPWGFTQTLPTRATVFYLVIVIKHNIKIFHIFQNLYDMLLKMLEERGINAGSIDQLTNFASQHDHNQYVNLLKSIKDFVLAKWGWFPDLQQERWVYRELWYPEYIAYYNCRGGIIHMGPEGKNFFEKIIFCISSIYKIHVL